MPLQMHRSVNWRSGRQQLPDPPLRWSRPAGLDRSYALRMLQLPGRVYELGQ